MHLPKPPFATRIGFFILGTLSVVSALIYLGPKLSTLPEGHQSVRQWESRLHSAANPQAIRQRFPADDPVASPDPDSSTLPVPSPQPVVALPGYNFPAEPATPARCLSDRVDPTQVGNEIRELEADFQAGPLTGSWGPLELSKLPKAQASYLSRYGKWLPTPDIVNYSGCTDLLCVLDRVYNGGKAGVSSSEALYHYLWYLKMGYALSTVTDNPENVELSHNSYSDILFNPTELQGFWLLSHDLSKRYRHMASLQTFHRMPRRVYLSQYGSGTCGLATGNRNQGHITLMDGCLTFQRGVLPTPPEFANSFFFEGVSHEMTHRLDDILGPDARTSLSQTEEWLSLSGWSSQEYVDPDTSVLSRRWKINSGDVDGFVRSYTATTPLEDFADTTAYFRHSPVETFRKSPRKYRFIRDRVYGGSAYAPDDLPITYSILIENSLNSQIPRIIKECENAQASDSYSISSSWRGFSQLDLPVLPHSVRACLGSKLAVAAQSELLPLRQQEWEACSALENPSLVEKLSEALAFRIQPVVLHEAELSTRLGPRVQALELFRNSLSELLDPKQLALECWEDPTGQPCYEAAAKREIRRLVQADTTGYAASLKDVLPSLLPGESSRWIASHKYPDAVAALVKLVIELTSGAEPTLKSAGIALWTRCQNVPGVGSSDLPQNAAYSPFSGGDLYVDPWILACINQSANDEIDNAIDQVTGRVGIHFTDQRAKNLARKLVESNLIEALNAQLKSGEKIEMQSFQALVQQLGDQVASDLETSKDWVGSSSSATHEELTRLCIPKAQEHLEVRWNMLSSASRPVLRFHSVTDIKLQISQSSCKSAISALSL